MRINQEGQQVQLYLNVLLCGTDVSLPEIALLIVGSQCGRQPWVLAVAEGHSNPLTMNVKDMVRHATADGGPATPPPLPLTPTSHPGAHFTN